MPDDSSPTGALSSPTGALSSPNVNIVIPKIAGVLYSKPYVIGKDEPKQCLLDTIQILNDKVNTSLTGQDYLDIINTVYQNYPYTKQMCDNIKNLKLIRKQNIIWNPKFEMSDDESVLSQNWKVRDIKDLGEVTLAIHRYDEEYKGLSLSEALCKYELHKTKNTIRVPKSVVDNYIKAGAISERKIQIYKEDTKDDKIEYTVYELIEPKLYNLKNGF